MEQASLLEHFQSARPVCGFSEKIKTGNGRSRGLLEEGVELVLGKLVEFPLHFVDRTPLDDGDRLVIRGHLPLRRPQMDSCLCMPRLSSNYHCLTVEGQEIVECPFEEPGKGVFQKGYEVGQPLRQPHEGIVLDQVSFSLD